jgi:hypothetical protein
MKRFVYAVLLVAFVGLAPACANNPKPDTSQLSAQGHRDYTATQVVKLVNDVTTAATTANAAKKLSDAHTAAVLTVNKQVLDVVEANPVDFKAKAITVFNNARQALPGQVQGAIAGYLQQVASILSGVQ